MRNRAAVILVNGKNQLALMKRKRDGFTYYVFPGGGIKKDETPDKAAEREAFEELGVRVKVQECLAEMDFHGTQYFFLADIIDGEFGSGKGEEFTGEYKEKGTYLPMWIELEELLSIDVWPEEVARKIKSKFIEE